MPIYYHEDGTEQDVHETQIEDFEAIYPSASTNTPLGVVVPEIIEDDSSDSLDLVSEKPKDEIELLKQIPSYYDQERTTPDPNIGFFPTDDIQNSLIQPTDQITNQVAEFYTTQENQYQKDKFRLSQIDNPEAKAYKEENNPDNLTQAQLDAKNNKDLAFFAEPDILGGNAPEADVDMYGIERSSDYWNQSDELLEAREEFMLAETNKAKGFVFNRNGNDPIKVDKEISNYSPSLLSEEDQEIQALIRQGDQPGADALAEEKGYVKLANKDGSFKDYMPDKQYEKAVDFATSTNLDDLKAKQREIYSRMIAAQQLANRNVTGGVDSNFFFGGMSGGEYGVGITDHVASVGGGSLQAAYLMSDAAKAAATNSKANQLIKPVKPIPGSAPIAEEHNRTLNELKTITQAIELNINPELLPEGSHLGEIIENRLRSVVSNDERAEIFKGITEEIGLKPKSEFKREGDYYGRSVVEGSRDFVDSFAELAASLYVFKRIPLGTIKKGKEILTFEVGMTTGVNKISKAIKASTNSKTVARISDVGLGAVKEMVTLGGADVVGDHLFGSEGFVYNKKTKDLHLAFPGALGAGNVISKKVLDKVLRTESNFTRMLGRLNKGVENGTLSAIGTATAGAVTGTAVLTFGELVAEGLSSEQQYREMEDGSFETIDEWKEIVGGRKLLETFIGMYMLGGKGTITNMYRGMKADVARIVKKSTVRGGEAAKRMGIPVNSTNDTIKTTTASKIKEINESNLSPEQKLERIKEVKADSESLYWHNEAITAQKLAKKDDAYIKARENTFALANKIKQNKDLTPEEIQRFHDLKPYEFDLMKAKLGASKDSRFGQMLDNQRDIYKSVIEAVNKSRVYEAGGSDERNASIKLWMKVSDIGGQIRALQTQAKNNVTMEGVNKKKITDLNEKQKGLIEQLEQKGVEYDARLKEMMKGEIEFAELMAAELDAGFKVQTETEYLKAGGKKGSEGRFVREKGKRDILYINETAALEARQLGTPLHEITHAILKNSLKETIVDKKTGKEKEVVSEEGMVIIKQFLNKLGTKERAAVEERMEKNYKYEKYENGDFVLINGKKIKRAKEDYYEEHITAFSDILKNKEIKQTPGLANRIGDVFIPLLRKAGFKNLRAVGTGSGEGIYNMIKSLQISSEKRSIDKDVLNVIKKTKKTTVDNIAESRTVTEAMEKASTELDKIYAEEGISGYNKIIDRIKGKNAEGEKVSKDFIKYYTEIYRDHAGYESKKDILYNEMANHEIYGVLGSIMSYNPVKNPSIGSHILGRLKQGKHIDVANIVLGKDAQRQFTKSLDIAETKEIEAKQLSPEELFDIKLAEEQRTQAPNLRKSLKKGEEKGIDQKLIDKVENTVLKTFGNKLPLPETKGFKKALNDSYKTELKTPIADLMGKGPEYEIFLRDNFESIMKFIDKKYFISAESQLPRNERVFTEVEIESMSVKETDKAIREERVPKSTSRTAGNTLWKFKMPAPAEFIKFFIPPKEIISKKTGKLVKSGLKGTRKDRLAEIIGIELAKDMTSQVVSKPEVIAKIKDISVLELEGSIEGIDKLSQKVKEAREMVFDNYVERVASEIGKDPNQMFSETQFLKEVEELKKLVKSTRNFGDKFDIGTGKPLKGEYLDKSIEAIYYGWSNELIRTNEFIKKEIDKVVKKGKAKDKGIGFEYVFSKNGKKQAKSIKGLEIDVNVGEKPFDFEAIEGSDFKGGKFQAADAMAIIHGTQNAIELKVSSARFSKNSIGEMNYTEAAKTIAEGKPVKFKRKSVRKSSAEERLVEIAAERAIAKGAEIMRKALVENGILKEGEPFTSTTKNPLWSHNKMSGKEIAKLADISVKADGKFAAADYNKKGNFIFHAFEKGTFYLGSDPRGMFKQAGAAKLELVVPLKARLYSSSYTATSGPYKRNKEGEIVYNKKGKPVYPTAGHTYKLVVEGLFEPKNITSKTNLNLDRPGAWKKVLLTPASQLLGQRIRAEAKALKSNKQKDNTGFTAESKTNREYIKNAKIVDKALELGRKKNKKARGMSTFDFDETLREKGKEFVTATKGKKSIKISSEKFPLEGSKLEKQGYEFDFKDFVNVKGGVKGPLFKKLQNQIAKYGSENVFVLTARMQESAPAIHAWLKSKGIEIPIKNITGLGKSTGEAKALWMLEKFGQGYNDMYFVDDALPNVKAVKNVLSQLDIKSKVQQVYSKTTLDKDINNIMEHSFGVEAKKRFSQAEGKVRGRNKKRRKFFIPDSAADLELLIEPLLGKGKKGIENRKWFNENFHKPFERGINDLNTTRQTVLNDYMSLRKQNKDVVKSLDKPVEGTNFTTDQAARVYIWNKAGFEVPGLTKTSKTKLLEHVANNPKLQAYAESAARLTKIETGLKKPSEHWWAETLATEVSETGRTISRDKYIGDWIEAKNEIFSKENLAKMESELGPRWREAIDGMLWRMETGRMRKENLDRLSNEVMDYLNGATGAIMHLNTRSAALQLISTVNFINHGENNPFAAAKAFANQPQYWKDFMHIMNSPMLKQRRQGLEINVSEAELAAASRASGKGFLNSSKRVLATILKHGYLPTKIADSFAIASGGATYYRNRIKMYEKQGLKTKEAEKKAWIDFQAIAEKTQQSSRPDLLSQQQVSMAGRLILPFGNTPMQMNRIGMKEVLDISKGRFDGFYGENSFTHKMSKISYYWAIQSAIFAGLQSAAFAVWTMGDDEPLMAQKKVRAANTMADSFLRGMGIKGAVLAGFKNALMKFSEQDKKGFFGDFSEVGEALLNISPTIGSKFSVMDGSGNTYKYNKKEIKKKGLNLDNTKGIEAVAQVIQAVTNAPTYNYIKKNRNIQSALDQENELWQRIHNWWGYSPWDVGAADYQEKQKTKSKSKSKSKSRKSGKLKKASWE